MAVTHPTTRLDLFTVPWGKPEECHAIVDFPTAAAQVAAFDELAKKGVSATKFNYIKKDQAFRIEGNFARFEAFNYCRYQNCDFVNRQGNKKWYYAFIDRVEYIAQDVAMIYISTDYWQTYQFNITYYKSLIARAHVKKSEDTVGRWLQPEPVGAPADYEKEIDVFSAGDSWVPYWSMVSVSRPPGPGESDWIYGGYGKSESMTGQYAGFVYDNDTIQKLIDVYAGETDRRKDIITFRCIPYWVYSMLKNNGYVIPVTVKGKEINYCKENITITLDTEAEIAGNTLACGYTPRNKKMLTSMCRVYVVYNYNGFSQPLRPEFIKGNSIKMSAEMRPIGSNGFKLKIKNYAKPAESVFDVPYSFEMQIGYNENGGVQGSLNRVGSVLNAAGAVAGGAVSLGANIATGNVAGAITSGVGAVSSIFNTSRDIANAFNSKVASKGNQSDTNSISSENCKFRLVDCSPLYDECGPIDDFLDLYGYAINEWGKISRWKDTRSKWNYLQTVDCNIKVNAPAPEAASIRTMFNTGVTIWHSISAFGDYSLNND
jgi:hypothetical protein